MANETRGFKVERIRSCSYGEIIENDVIKETAKGNVQCWEVAIAPVLPYPDGQHPVILALRQEMGCYPMFGMKGQEVVARLSESQLKNIADRPGIKGIRHTADMHCQK